ncbi:sigma-54-dependent transcriptional regulator [Clostridium merdae]|uniref:sigma-54-dependent transcriptional regulator n=1 Tax=Clostridium merdae TaxID=1958780 RepID=UPI000A2678FE|nr:sigma-54 dependent transcriptional regulator [Clostridium merdae]
MQSKILIIDDEYLIRISLREGLTDLGYNTQEAGSIEEGLQLAEQFRPDVVMLDNRLGNVLGIEYIEAIKKLDEDIQIIIMTAYSSISQAVQAIRRGAYDYVQKPFDIDAIDIVIRRALEQLKSRRKLELLSAGEPPDFIGISPQMQQMKKQVELLGKQDNVDLLVRGETGSGKGVVVAQIHQKSARRNFPLVKINCSAVPENLFESELFGHEKGAFTGALARKKGLFELANEGTVFLDEIGDMPLAMQAKLLTFLEDRKFRRVGGLSDVEVNVRVIAATNRPLEQAIEEKAFRADLFFRLNVVQLYLAPLRERPEDIEPLCHYYLDFFNQKLGKNIRQISPAFLQTLMGYSWKGNVRELRNVLERAVLFCNGDVLEHTGQLLEESGSLQAPLPSCGECWPMQDLSQPIDLQKELERLELAYIEKALKRTGDNYSQAAKLLGYSRFSLRRRLEQ